MPLLIALSIISFLDASDIIRLSRVYLVQFRKLQAATGALIVKHVTLGFFERRIIETREEDVDLTMCVVVEDDTEAVSVKNYLKEKGYLIADILELETDSEVTNPDQSDSVE
ncbi:hypothetical protein DE146DRAFT_626737 [Phaeosphaeria sp. MPI-PUGE-AT-0046c]|nr:hypothetical protein DE146DRAFT_626737 [Phaeosphaeria sp. MPI-PUGE-AT-0046c]